MVSLRRGKIRVGVVGVGHFGRLHAAKYAASKKADLVGVVDTDAARLAAVTADIGVCGHCAPEALFGLVDAVSIAVPTSEHYTVARRFLEAGVHVLLEKPMTGSIERGEALIDIASRRGVVLQVGQIERFSGAYRAIHRYVERPLFIECHRIAPYRPRGTDVTVVLDLMIHDIDLILSLNDAPVESVDAAGTPILSSSDDIANSRINFTDGCVANVTASRVGYKNERSMRIFGPDTYLSVDFVASRLTRLRKINAGGSIDIERTEDVFENVDSLADEIDSFIDAVQLGRPPVISGEDGLRNLRVATLISDSLMAHREKALGRDAAD